MDCMQLDSKREDSKSSSLKSKFDISDLDEEDSEVEEIEPDWIPWLYILDEAYPSRDGRRKLDLSDPIFLLFTKTFLRQNQTEIVREVIEGEDYPIVCIPRERKSDYLAQFEVKFSHLPIFEDLKENKEEDNEEEEDKLTQSSRKYTE